MSGTKKTLVLDQYEYGVIFHSLNDRRNRMLEVIQAMEPSGKEKRRHKHHEER